MSRREEPVPAERRTIRVVSLPCGHQVYVGPEATLLGASGPVLDHQASCHGRTSSPVAAWFVPLPISRHLFLDPERTNDRVPPGYAPLPSG